MAKQKDKITSAIKKLERGVGMGKPEKPVKIQPPKPKSYNLA